MRKLLSFLLFASPFLHAENVYVYMWENNNNGQIESMQRFYASESGLIMEQLLPSISTSSNGGNITSTVNWTPESEMVVLDAGQIIMNDASNQSSFIIDPENLPDMPAMNFGTNPETGEAIDMANISDAVMEQYQQVLADLPPEQREAYLEANAQIQQLMQEGMEEAAASRVENEAEEEVSRGLGGLFGGRGNNPIANAVAEEGVGAALGGLFGGNKKKKNDDNDSGKKSGLGGLFGGKKKNQEPEPEEIAGTTEDLDPETMAAIQAMMGNQGQQQPPEFRETGNSGSQDGIRWEEVEMTMLNTTTLYRLADWSDVAGADLVSEHYGNMANIFEQFINNMGLGGFAQGMQAWPNEITAYMQENKKFPIYIQEGNNIQRLTGVNTDNIEDERFGAQYPVRSMFEMP